MEASQKLEWEPVVWFEPIKFIEKASSILKVSEIFNNQYGILSQSELEVFITVYFNYIWFLDFLMKLLFSSFDLNPCPDLK